jgi:hypothetical protein
VQEISEKAGGKERNCLARIANDIGNRNEKEEWNFILTDLPMALKPQTPNTHLTPKQAKSKPTADKTGLEDCPQKYSFASVIKISSFYWTQLNRFYFATST